MFLTTNNGEHSLSVATIETFLLLALSPPCFACVILLNMKNPAKTSLWTSESSSEWFPETGKAGLIMFFRGKEPETNMGWEMNINLIWVTKNQYGKNLSCGAENPYFSKVR